MNPTMALSQPNATSEDTEIVICRGRAQCKGADTWPCPLCFRVSVSDSWRVEEILPKLQRRDHRVRRGQHQTKESGVTFASIPLVSASYRKNPPPIRGRELSSREAVLPFCTCVKEDGLQGPTGGPAEATRHGVRARLDFGFVDLVYGALVESTEQIRLIGTLPQKKWPGPNKDRFGASTR